MIHTAAMGEELTAAHRGGHPAEQRERVERPERGERERQVEPGVGRDPQRQRPEKRVRIGLGDDGEAGALDPFAGVELDLEA